MFCSFFFDRCLLQNRSFYKIGARRRKIATYPLQNLPGHMPEVFSRAAGGNIFLRFGVQRLRARATKSIMTHGSFVPRRFVPGLRRFVTAFDQFVPNSLVDSYPTTCHIKFLKFLSEKLFKTFKMHARTRKVYV